MAATAGETLLENISKEEPEGVAPEPVVEQASESVADPPKRRRQRKDEPVAEVATEPAPEASIEPEVAPPSETPEWLGRVQELGLQNVKDEADARDRLIELTLRERQERERLESDYQRRLRELEYRQTAAATPQSPAVPDRKPWQPPVDYPQAATRYLQGANEDGTPNWKPDTPAEVRAKTEQFIAWRDDIRDVLLNRPDVFFNEMLPQFIEEHSKKVIEPYYEQKTAEEKQQEFFGGYMQQNAEWLFAKDPMTGEPDSRVLSRTGELLNQRIQFHMDHGLSPQDAVEYAQYDVQRQTRQTPWAPPEPSPQQVREENKKKTLRKPLNGAGSVAQRSGSFTEPEAETPQNGNVSPGRRLLDRMHREGIQPPYAAAT